jgi:hypothetical protein
VNAANNLGIARISRARSGGRPNLTLSSTIKISKEHHEMFSAEIMLPTHWKHEHEEITI